MQKGQLLQLQPSCSEKIDVLNQSMVAWGFETHETQSFMVIELEGGVWNSGAPIPSLLGLLFL